MKILQLCKKFPYPLKDGESIAVTYLAKAMAELGCSVTLLAMNTSKHWFDIAHLPEGFDHYQSIHEVLVDNRIKPLDAFQNLFAAESYHIQRFVDAGFAKKLKEILENERFDVVQLETLYMAPYLPMIRKYSDAIIVMRAHNVEHEIWERVAANSHPLKRWYLNHITPRLRQFEIENLNRYDLLAGISARDIQHFRNYGLEKPAILTPIGLDSRDYLPDDSSYSRPLSLAFIGSLDWMPNVEGLKWFLDEVWGPLLSRRFPELEFHIAGRNTPGWLKRLHLPGVKVHGEVPSATDFINQHSLLVVPLLSGGGMRAKILEGMALGKVVLSTRIGMEGIDARHKQEALLADTPEDFAKSVSWCLKQGLELQALGARAQSFFAGHFDNLSIGRRLVQRYRDLAPGRPVVV